MSNLKNALESMHILRGMQNFVNYKLLIKFNLLDHDIESIDKCL